MLAALLFMITIQAKEAECIALLKDALGQPVLMVSEPNGKFVRYIRTNQGLEVLQRSAYRTSLFDLEAWRSKAFRILDVSSGDGRFVEDLRSEGLNVFGLDLHLTGNQKSKSYFVEADAGHSPFPDASFDIITSSEGVIPYRLSNGIPIGDLLLELSRILKPGGRMFITSVSARSLEDVLPGELRVIEDLPALAEDQVDLVVLEKILLATSEGF